MPTYMLDADTLCYILRRRDDRDRRVLSQLRHVLSENATVILCPMVLYETLRGLIRNKSVGQMRFLGELSRVLVWDDLRKPDWEAAAVLWAECSLKHRSPGNADMVIAAHAKRHGAIVVTGNEKHFQDLGVLVENWTKE